MSCTSGKAQSSISMHHALEHLHGRLDLEEAQHDGLVLAEELSRGDAKEEGVADLAGGAGDGDVDGGLRCRCHRAMDPFVGREWRRAGAAEPPARSEPVDDGGRELRALDLGGTLHQPGEVVGDDLVGDGGLQGCARCRRPRRSTRGART